MVTLMSSIVSHALDLQPSDPQPWEKFRIQAEFNTSEEEKYGLAYMISGALVLIAGGVGYREADDNASQFALSLTQSLGIAGIGYGAYLYNIGGRHRRFYDVVSGVPSLSPEQRHDLALSYYRVDHDQVEKAKWIKVLSYGLISVLNLYHASQTDDENLSTALYFVGGVSGLAAISYTF